jgi:hypothetical protein
MFVSVKSDLSVGSALSSTAAGSRPSRCESCEESAPLTPVKAEKTSESLPIQTAEGMKQHPEVS